MSGNKLILVKNDANHNTPVNSANWFPIDFSTASFQPDIQKTNIPTGTSRVESSSRITKMTESGSIEGDLVYGVFDDLIAAAFCNGWTANSLTSGGDVVQSFTAEEERGNLTANKFIPHSVFVETMSLSGDFAGESLSLSFGVKGSNPQEPQATSKVGTGTVSDDSIKTRLIPSDIGFLKVDGVTVCVNSFSLEVTNTLVEVACLTDTAPKEYRLGKKQKIELKIDPELDDVTVGHYIKSMNEGSASFTQEYIDPDDPANKYTLTLAEVGFTSTIPAMTSSDDLERMGSTMTVQNQAGTLVRT